MLLHPDVNFSTFPAEYRCPAARKSCNEWLQCIPMRIELPSTSWADTVQRAEDDAHTLTVATQPATEWLGGSWRAEPQQALRTQVGEAQPVFVTITF